MPISLIRFIESDLSSDRLNHKGEVVVLIEDTVLAERPCTPAVHATQAHLCLVDADVGDVRWVNVWRVEVVLVLALVQALDGVVQGRGRERLLAQNADTVTPSRRIFRQLPNHQLHTVSAACGYQLEKHHHALADAEACAWIAREIL